MQDIQGKVFSDLEDIAISDGGFRGRKKIADANRKHYDMKFDQELLKVNQRLKSSKTKVSIEATKGALQLRATLPLKPNETHPQGKDKKQYKISLGIPANFPGLKTAEEEAYELGRLIARKMFIWSDKYLGVQATKDKGITFREFYEQFEDRYFEKRKKTIRSENSLRVHQSTYKTYFLVNQVITSQQISKILDGIQSEHARRHSVAVASFIKDELNIDIDLSKYKFRYKPKKRGIPHDNLIVTSINKFEARYKTVPRMTRSLRNSWKVHKIIYSLLAIYGLRPREIFNKPDLEWFLSKENKHNTFKVHESNKTGYREVFPFVPEWVELFDLKNKDAINLLKEKVNSWRTVGELTSKVQSISSTFRVCEIPFTPYDLRHACAIRAHLQGIPVKASADNLGHTVEIHTKVYQQWFGLENRRKAFEQTFESVNEVDALKDENTQLKKRIAELETELARYKLGKMM